MKAVFVDDFGTASKPVEITKEEMDRRNRYPDEMALDEYGKWIELSKIREVEI